MKKSAKKTKRAAKRTTKDLTPKNVRSVRGGAKADGSLDAGIHFKYDIRGSRDA